MTNFVIFYFALCPQEKLSSALLSVLASYTSVCSSLSVLSEQHGTGACGTEPSVSHRGGTARHATTIRAMHLLPLPVSGLKLHPCVPCTLSLYCSVMVRHVVPYSQGTSHCHFGQFLNVTGVSFVFPPWSICFACFLTLLVKSFSLSISPCAHLRYSFLTG